MNKSKSDKVHILDQVNTIDLSWDVRENVVELIKQGSVNTEDSLSLSKEDIEKLLGPDSDQWDNYSEIHLARNIDFERDDKKRYIYPVVKDGIVFKSALISAKKQAKKDDSWVMHSIDSLIGMINKTEGIINTDNIRSETRVDLFGMPGSDKEIDPFMESPFKKNDDGFLVGRAIVTNIGVFRYKKTDENGDIVIIRELRHPDDVFDPESTATLRMLPITDTHAGGKVDIDNIKELQAGSTGDEIRRDNLHLSLPMKITKKETIDGIVEDGRKGISQGYKVDLVDQSGVFLGMPYDVRQTNIRYNHTAVNIDMGRAGDATIIKTDERFDSFDAVLVDDETIEDNNRSKNLNKEDHIMAKFKIDGAEFETEREVIQHINKIQSDANSLQEKVKTLEKDNKELEGTFDELKGEKAKLDKELVEAKKANPEKIDEAVDERIKLIGIAKKHDVELKADDSGKVTLSNDEIKKAIICKDAPEGTAEKLDEKDSVYLNARFDAKLETLEAKELTDEEKAADANAKEVQDGDDKNKPEPKTSKEKHDAYVESLENAHKQKDK